MLSVALFPANLRGASSKGKTVDCCEHRDFGFGICRDAAGVCSFGSDGWDPLISVTCQSGGLRQITFQRFDGRIPFDLASTCAGCFTDLWTDHGGILHIDEVLHTGLVLGLFRRSHSEAFIEKKFFGDWSQHLRVIDADDKLSFVQRLKKTRARASPDILSGPERFLKQVGPQIIAYLPIAVSSTNVTGDAQPVTRRSTLLSTPFASLESRFCSSYLCRVVPPATRRKFNCVGLARKSIFGAARFQSTTVHHDIARHLVHLSACNETNFRLN